jgi:hypothetical protein
VKRAFLLPILELSGLGIKSDNNLSKSSSALVINQTIGAVAILFNFMKGTL